MPVDVMLAVLLLIVLVNVGLLVVLQASDRLALKVPHGRRRRAASPRQEPVHIARAGRALFVATPDASPGPSEPPVDLDRLLAPRPPSAAGPAVTAALTGPAEIATPRDLDGGDEASAPEPEADGAETAESGSAPLIIARPPHASHLPADLSRRLTLDPLTGLEDPAGWSRIMEIENARLLRYRRPVTIVVAELEGLRRLVDRLGEEPAQRLLPVVADAFRREARGSDWIARIGESRFIALLPETDEIQAINFIERVRLTCEPWLASAAVPMRLAMGWASPPASGDLDFAVACAEERMHVDRRSPARPVQGGRVPTPKVVSLPPASPAVDIEPVSMPSEPFDEAAPPAHRTKGRRRPRSDAGPEAATGDEAAE